MKVNNLSFILQALLAAIFFGASAPIAKLLLGDIAPIFLAAFLYIGSGTGISLVKLTQRMRSKEVEAGIKRAGVARVLHDVAAVDAEQRLPHDRNGQRAAGPGHMPLVLSA